MLIAIFFLVGVASTIGIAFGYIKVIDEPLKKALYTILDDLRADLINLLAKVIIYITCVIQSLYKGNYTYDALKPFTVMNVIWNWIDIIRGTLFNLVYLSVILIFGLLVAFFLIPKRK